MMSRNVRLPNALRRDGDRQVAEHAGDRDEAEDREDPAEGAPDKQEQSNAPIA